MFHPRRPGPDELEQIDFGDPQTYAECDLSLIWEHLRSNNPVFWHNSPSLGCGFWAITRHSDALAVYRDSDSFSSRYGNVLDVLSIGRDSAAGKMLAVSDGKPHSELRKILLRAFTSHALDVVIRCMRVATYRLVRAALEEGKCDFATDIAALIPLAAVCDLLKVPVRDRNYILSLTSTALASNEGTPKTADTWGSKADILQYFSHLVRFRRAQEDNDIVSLLANCDVAGRKLSDEEVVVNCYSIVLAGDETTRLAMIGGTLAFIENPEQWHALKTGSAAIASSVEEILRWTTPTLHGARTATGSMAFGGQMIGPKDIVTVWNVSANADERQFRHPEKFDLSRSPNRHVAFAYGPHFCLGAFLARAEISALLRTFKATISEMEVKDVPKRIYSNFLHGYSSLPIILAADAKYRLDELLG